jgi:ligand-binding sensor domain-containing protein
MKKLIILSALISIISCYADTFIRDWKSYTNTTHISDIMFDNNRLLLATWGGLVEYNITDMSFEGPFKREDGLTENELSSLGLLPDGTLLIGSKGGGISRLKDAEIKMPLQMESGLPSDFVYDIASYGSKFVAVTAQGISVFNEMTGWPLPSVMNYNQSNGLTTQHYNTIAISEDGILFCGSDFGIDYADLNNENLSWQHLNTGNSGLTDNRITSISWQNEAVAIGTQSGLHYTENFIDDHSWQVYGSGRSYYPVFLDEIGNIWAGTGYWDEDELAVLGSGEEVIIKLNSDFYATAWTKAELNLFSGHVTGITALEDGIAISTWGEGILLYNGIYWSEPFAQDCIATNFATVLKMDNNNRIWVGNGILSPPDTRRGNRGVSVWNGVSWNTFSSVNSGLVSNNINSIVPLPNNCFWFTSYSNLSSSLSGINVLDYSNIDNPLWDFYPYNESGYQLPTGNIGNSFLGSDGNIWLCCYNGGILLTNEAREQLHFFIAPHIVYGNSDESNAMMMFQGEQYSVAGGKLTGFEIWLGSDIPETENTQNWLQPDHRDFKNGQVFDALERHENFQNQIWIASTEGLFMYDAETWYRYGKDSTKRQYLAGSGTSLSWQPQKLIIGENDSPQWWYFEGQERLYGGVNTYPRSLLVDPFNNLWIGTATNGICRYDIENNLFKTYNTANSPLLSDAINDLEYDKNTGTLYIATDKGLNSVNIGISESDNQEVELNDILVYPNPFYPLRDGTLWIENKNHFTMPQGGTTCHLYDLEGLLVNKLQLNNFQQFEWDGTNEAGKNCSSGIYFFVITTKDKAIERGKIILVR